MLACIDRHLRLEIIPDFVSIGQSVCVRVRAWARAQETCTLIWKNEIFFTSFNLKYALLGGVELDPIHCLDLSPIQVQNKVLATFRFKFYGFYRIHIKVLCLFHIQIKVLWFFPHSDFNPIEIPLSFGRECLPLELLKMYGLLQLFFLPVLAGGKISFQ